MPSGAGAGGLMGFSRSQAGAADFSAGVVDPHAAAAAASVTAATHRYQLLVVTVLLNLLLCPPLGGPSRTPNCTMRAVIRQFRIVLLIGLATAGYVATSTAQSNSSAGRALIVRAAEALGGRDRLLALKTLTIEGYGQLAYQNGGGNITSSIDAPQKWISVSDYVRTVDLEHMRTRVRQRQANEFVFAAAQNMKGVVSTQSLDGDVAFNVNAAGAATRAPAAAARARRR